ncbi:hypothetical protein EVAR_51862_1 [Eumeta japonica]|uniref:Uncharacterized protein n=1 Tax=Eumeta variegata TaxID=151549 RepID=A0A4C1YTT6_EUMVA|nr:hypothetical protein EVAR_51862_1 [Eumeta japonica]
MRHAFKVRILFAHRPFQRSQPITIKRRTVQKNRVGIGRERKREVVSAAEREMRTYDSGAPACDSAEGEGRGARCAAGSRRGFCSAGFVGARRPGAPGTRSATMARGTSSRIVARSAVAAFGSLPQLVTLVVGCRPESRTRDARRNVGYCPIIVIGIDNRQESSRLDGRNNYCSTSYEALPLCSSSRKRRNGENRNAGGKKESLRSAIPAQYTSFAGNSERQNFVHCTVYT